MQTRLPRAFNPKEGLVSNEYLLDICFMHGMLVYVDVCIEVVNHKFKQVNCDMHIACEVESDW